MQKTFRVDLRYDMRKEPYFDSIRKEPYFDRIRKEPCAIRRDPYIRRYLHNSFRIDLSHKKSPS